MKITIRHMRIAIRVLATAGLLIERYYFGPLGAGAGIMDGLILAAIWVMREPDTKG